MRDKLLEGGMDPERAYAFSRAVQGVLHRHSWVDFSGEDLHLGLDPDGSDQETVWLMVPVVGKAGQWECLTSKDPRDLARQFEGYMAQSHPQP